jgi:hypothetical protein
VIGSSITFFRLANSAGKPNSFKESLLS